MKFNSEYKLDNKILAYTPLILLLWYFKVDNINKILIILICLSNLLYWHNKNIYSCLFDIVAANLFILYALYKSTKNNRLDISLFLLIPIIYFYNISINNIYNDKRQIKEHLIFRFFALILFLINYQKII